jgi:hypothetical protein
MQKLTADQLTALLETLDIPAIGEPGSMPNGIPPLIIKKLRVFQQGISQRGNVSNLYEVKLQYSSSSQTYKIKSNSFQGAAREALSRRKTQQIPVNVIVTPLGKQ